MSLWDILSLTFFVTGAIAALVLAAWMFRRRSAHGVAGSAIMLSLLANAAWALSVPALSGGHIITALLFSAAYLCWIWTLYRLFANDERHTSVRPIRPVVMALALVELLQVALEFSLLRFDGVPQAVEMVFRLSVTFRLLLAVGALVLVHNLFVGASAEARQSLRWPAAALGLMWLYDLNFYTIAYLSDAIPDTLFDLRGLVVLVMSGLFALGGMREATKLSFHPSRSVAFQSFSLLVIGAYLIGMVLLAQALAYTGNDFARLLQVAFIVVASALPLILLPSKRLRAWLRVTATKHLFQHRYDYRTEWMRFTQTIGGGHEGEIPLQERAVKALAEITDSPKGLLLCPGEHGEFTLEARWQWPHCAVPAEAMPASFRNLFRERHYIVDLDDIREGRDDLFRAQDLPDWLKEETQAWAMVPLIHYGRVLGLVVLARPSVERRLDWEDFDLLRVAGQQIASYLAEQAGQEKLIEAHRFDEFNRRIAFVMHDIKNLASQLSLLARNAERHADNPEFQADMLVTLRNSAEKLNALMARLGRYGSSGAEKPMPLDLADCAAQVVARYEHQHEVKLVRSQPCLVMASREALEQALVHLIQNAIDASSNDAPVFLNVLFDGAMGQIEVIDSGAGMSQEFIRTRLFKPFQSSKPGGFGIGAFEARELIRAMGGRLDVESREGLGTRFHIRVPLALTAASGDNPERSEVA